MRHKPRRRLLAVALAVILAAVLGIYARNSMAIARATVYTTAGTASCFGTSVPATFQDAKIGLELLYFEGYDDVFVDITFPDGRIYTQKAAFGPSGNVDLGLGGVIDQPINAPSVTDVYGGQTFVPLFVTNDFPYGCYRVAARSSTHNALSAFAVIARKDPIPFGGQAKLRIEDRTTGALTVQHGGAVNVIGEGFRAQERVFVWITAPDGAVLNWPEQFNDPALAAQMVTNDAGRFVASFEFASYNSVGLYQFTAKGEQSGYTVIAPITLVARPVQQTGWAALRVAFPADMGAAQRSTFEVQGERFSPGERIDLWVNFPDGSVRGLPSQFADAGGMFYVELATDEVLPVGEYKMTAKGANSGSLVITSFYLEQTSGVNPIPPLPSADPFDPRVVESNSGDATEGSAAPVTCSLGEVSEAAAENNPGPEAGATGYVCR
jgi:hypothetical protein